MARKDNIFFFGLSLALWVYIIFRAVLSPFVYDEATTFLLYVHNNNFIPGLAHWSANNHFLNSFLAWLSYNVFGPEEWALRLPNILAFPVFCFYLFKISIKLKSDLNRRVLFMGVLIAPVFIEMFAFSRGYGLSFAALSGAIYYFLNSFERDKYSDRLGFYTANFLMLAANLTLLPLSLTFLAINFGFALWQGRALRQIIQGVLITGIPLVLAVFISFSLKEKGLLYYAAENGFWKGTVGSLLTAFLGDDGMLWQIWLVVVLVVAVFVFVISIKKAKEIFNQTTALFVLFLAPIVFYLFGYYFLGIQYPLDRAVLYLPFLLFLTFSFSVDNANLKIYGVGYLVLFFPFILFFSQNLSLTKATGFKWHTEQIPDAFYETIKKENKAALVGGYFLRQKNWEYLNIKSEQKLNVLQISDYPGSLADFQVINNYDSALFANNYNLILEDANSELQLLKRKKTWQTKFIVSKELPEVINAKGFTEFIKLETDSISGPIVIHVEMLLKSAANPFKGIIAFNVKDNENKALHYEEVRLNNLYQNLHEEKTVTLKLYLAKFPPKAKTITVFLWNIKDQDFELKSGKVGVYELHQ